jgi:sporulation protein YlmC with PRC-barrel domain
MRVSFSIALLAVGMVLALSPVLQADPPTVPRHEQPSGTSPQTSNDPGTMKTGRTGCQKLCQITDVIGMDIVGPSQEKLGKIENLAIDHNSGKVRYVVVSLNETVAEGGKLLPVPWNALKFVATTKAGEASHATKHCLLNLDKDSLAKAPSFQQGQRPDFSDQRWVTSIERFYQPYVAKRSGEPRSQ